MGDKKSQMDKGILSYFAATLWSGISTSDDFKVQKSIEGILKAGSTIDTACSNFVSDSTSIIFINKLRNKPVLAVCYNIKHSTEKFFRDIQFGIVKDLVGNGALVNTTCSDTGKTCLMFAAECDFELCRLLIEKQADVNACDNEGNSAFHYAMQYKPSGSSLGTPSPNPIIIELLLQNGGDATLKNAQGYDGLRQASLHGSCAVVDLIIRYGNLSDGRIAEEYKLLGCDLILSQNLIKEALNCWRKASDILAEVCVFETAKPMKVDGGSLFLQDTKEFQCVEELTAMETNRDALVMQSIVIYERILGPKHPHVPKQLAKCIKRLEDLRRSPPLVLNLMHYSLDVLFSNFKFFSEETTKAIHQWADYVIQNQGVDKETSNSMRVQLGDAVITAKLIIHNLASSCVKDTFKYITARTFQVKLLKILLLHANTPSDKEERDNLVRDIIVMHLKDPMTNDSLLHVLLNDRHNDLNLLSNMCYKTIQHNIQTRHIYEITKDLKSNDLLGIVEMLLKCGSSVNIVNSSRSSPLHLAATHTTHSDELVDLLVAYGGHLDQRNNEGVRVCSLLPPGSCWLRRPFALKCLSAQVLVNSPEIYCNEALPSSIKTFIELH